MPGAMPLGPRTCSLSRMQVGFALLANCVLSPMPVATQAVEATTTVLPSSAPGETLGCFHYNYAYQAFMPDASTLEPDVKSCQNTCALHPRCKGFSYWTAQTRCDLAEEGHSIFLQPTTQESGPAISGPQLCPPAPVAACREVPDPTKFPGKTVAESAAAFPSGHVPTNAQCWPRNSLGFPVPCPIQTYTVLEDMSSGWPAKCMNLNRNYPASGDTCQSDCLKTPVCSVWQQMNISGDVQCWHGVYGLDCYNHRPGFHPAASQRIMHGTYRVLKDLTGMRVMGLTWMFSGSVFDDASSAAAHCRLYCIGSLGCNYWVYSVKGGCFAEDPSKARVAYPLTLNPNVVETGTEEAKAIVAGEYIQHYCGGNSAFAGSAAAESASSQGGPSWTTATRSAGSSVSSSKDDAPTYGSGNSEEEIDKGSSNAGLSPTTWMWILSSVGLVIIIGGIVTYVIMQQFQKKRRRGASRDLAAYDAGTEDNGLLGAAGGQQIQMPGTMPKYAAQQPQYYAAQQPQSFRPQANYGGY